ncbi:MAG: hypothetical protein ACK5LC_16555 [Coprobacillaceae bacterium]
MLKKEQLLFLLEEELLVQRSMLFIICLAYESQKLEVDDVTVALQLLVERLDQVIKEL